MFQSTHEIRIQNLTKSLTEALSLEFHTYEHTRNYETCGIYLIYDEKDELIYIGKTGRAGKIRLRELTSDYRSHTLNRKLLRNLLAHSLENNDLLLTNRTKQQMIDDGNISEDDFKSRQNDINQMIKTKYKFKFYQVDESKLTETELFFIAVINPKFND
jgi:hypothetical protein